jgi:hypothetical protein
MDLREAGSDGMDRIDLAQDSEHCRAVTNSVMTLTAQLAACQEGLRSMELSYLEPMKIYKTPSAYADTNSDEIQLN